MFPESVNSHSKGLYTAPNSNNANTCMKRRKGTFGACDILCHALCCRGHLSVDGEANVLRAVKIKSCFRTFPDHTGHSKLRSAHCTTADLNHHTTNPLMAYQKDVYAHMQSQTGHHKTPGFFSRKCVESFAFGHLFLFVLFQRRCTILPATVKRIFNGSLSEYHGHSLNGTLWHLSSNYHGVDKISSDLFLEENRAKFELPCDIARVWDVGSLANSRLAVGTIFLVCTKICFITFQMVFVENSSCFFIRNTRISIKNEVVQMTFFCVSDRDWFHGCVALRAGPLDVFRVMKVQVFWNPDGHKMVSLSHLSLTLVRYVTREAQGGSGSGTASHFYCVHFSPDF